MRKILLSSTAAICFAFVGPAFADSNTAYIQQVGSNDLAQQDQSGGTGNSASAYIGQTSPTSYSQVRQTQVGTGNSSTVSDQNGYANGYNSYGVNTHQNGNYNSATASLNGAQYTNSSQTQTNDYNYGSVLVNGGSSNGITQNQTSGAIGYGSGGTYQNLAYATSNNSASSTISQTQAQTLGYTSLYNLQQATQNSQTGSSITQNSNGYSLTATATQGVYNAGSNNSISQTQVGNTNTVTSTQDGSSNLLISYQGNTGNQTTQSQTGNGNYGLTYQYDGNAIGAGNLNVASLTQENGDNNQAYQYQYANNDHATISQNGSSNYAKQYQH